MFAATALATLSVLAAEAPRIADATPVDPDSYTVEVVVGGLDHPWNISWLPGGDMLVTEHTGNLRVVRDGELLPTPVAGVPAVFNDRQAGLFVAEPHPNFAENGFLYLTYASGTGRSNTLHLARASYTATETGGTLSDVEVIFASDAVRASRLHYGGRLQWLEDGTLLLTAGEGSHAKYRVKAQSLDNHFGKILRLTEDGDAAPGNPFEDQAGAKPEIWSYGHRNPQGITQMPDGTIVTNEHGPKGGDEVNITQPGKNYGWPAITYGVDYSGALISPLSAAPGMEQPVFEWTPSIAPSSMVYYDQDDFPALQGKFLVGALAYKRLQIADISAPDAPQQSMLSERGQRIRDVAIGPDGHLYVATDAGKGPIGGQILRILPQE